MAFLNPGIPGVIRSPRLPRRVSTPWRPTCRYGKSDRPEPIDQYTIFHLVGDLGACSTRSNSSDAIIVGHDWGATIAGKRPPASDRFRAVSPASACHIGRAARCCPTSVMPRTADAQFYQLYFRNPASPRPSGAGSRATVHTMLYGVSGEGPIAADQRGCGKRWGREKSGMVPRDGVLLRGPGAPAALPGVAEPKRDLESTPVEFKRNGFFAAPSIIIAISTATGSLLAPFADVKVTVPALFVAGDRDMVVAVPAWTSISPTSNNSSRHCTTSRCCPAAATGLSRSARPRSMPRSLIRAQAAKLEPEREQFQRKKQRIRE